MSDYLWDKSGEADPEVEQLEELFEGLRFQPREFQLPELPRSQTRSKGARWPRLAAAAALVLMGLAGLWLVRHRHAGQSLTPPAIAQAPRTGEAVAVNEKPEADQLQSGSYPRSAGTLLMDSKRHERKLNQAQMQRTGRASFGKERSAPAATEATAPEQREEAADVGPRRRMEQQQEEQAEGVRAKEELMLALQVASSKLNHAQRKARGIAPSAAPADKPEGPAPNLME